MDRRVKYTQSVIRSTLLELLQDKNINQVTVSEVCKIADINRATFYRYYLDIYDLLKKIEDEFVGELNEILNKSKGDSIYLTVRELLDMFLQNKELVNVMFSPNNSIEFLNELLQTTYEKCSIKFRNDIPDVTEKDIEYVNVFIFNGALGIINYWVNRDFDQDVDTIAKTIQELCLFGIKKYLLEDKKN